MLRMTLGRMKGLKFVKLGALVGCFLGNLAGSLRLSTITISAVLSKLPDAAHQWISWPLLNQLRADNRKTHRHKPAQSPANAYIAVFLPLPSSPFPAGIQRGAWFSFISYTTPPDLGWPYYSHISVSFASLHVRLATSFSLQHRSCKQCLLC